MIRIALNEVANARSGDKGNKLNIGLFVPNEQIYQIVLPQVTPQAIGKHFAEMGCTDIRVYPLPNILAFNIVLYGALPGGASWSLRVDNMGKTAAAALLRMPINIPSSVVTPQR